MIDLDDDSKVINICIESKTNKKNKYEQISDFIELFKVYKQYPNWWLGKPIGYLFDGKSNIYRTEDGRILAIIAKPTKERIRIAWWRIRHHKGFLNRHELRKNLKKRGEVIIRRK